MIDIDAPEKDDYQEMVKKLTNEVIAQIELDIENQVIDVSTQSKNIDPLIHKEEAKRKLKKKKKPEPTLDQLRRIKQSKLQEIRQIEMKESSLKKSALLQKSKVSNSCSRLWKSEFTEEEVAEIKRVIKKQKRFEQKLLQKEKSLQLLLAQKRKEEQQLKKQYLAEQCEQRKKELQKQRQELGRRKQERRCKLEEQIKRLQQLKSKKLLHEKMNDSWQRYQQSSEGEKEKVWEMQRQRKKLNTKEIEEHEAKYLQNKKQLQKKREQVLQQSRSAKTHLPYIHAQIFYKLQKQQQLQCKLRQIKSHQKEDNITKKKLFSKQVHQLFLPKVKHHSSTLNESGELKKQVSKLSLNAQQSYELGNNYMKAVHGKITTKHIQKQKQSLLQPEQPAGNSAFYQNYLKQLKAQSEKQNSKNTLSAVEKTLKNKKLSQPEKLEKVKLLFDREKSHKKSDSQLIESIKGKMRVLQEIGH